MNLDCKIDITFFDYVSSGDERVIMDNINNLYKSFQYEVQNRIGNNIGNITEAFLNNLNNNYTNQLLKAVEKYQALGHVYEANISCSIR